MTKIAIVIDGDSHICKDFFAGGENPVRTFSNRLLSLSGKYRTNDIVTCWDSGNSFRREIYPEYKANRQPKPEGLPIAIEEAKGVAADMGLQILTGSGYESDDWAATACEELLTKEWRVILASSDKDFRQLIRKGLVSQLYSWKGGAYEIMTEDRLFSEFGVSPSQWLDMQILMGDSTDNIKGCLGIGEVKAKKLITSAGSLKRLMERPDEFATGAVLSSLLAFREDGLELTTKLCTLVRDAKEEPEDNGEYLLQNRTGGFVGNSPVFWREGGGGYTPWIDEAKRWTRKEAELQIRSTRGTHEWEIWPVEIIEAKAKRTVDIQDLVKA